MLAARPASALAFAEPTNPRSITRINSLAASLVTMVLVLSPCARGEDSTQSPPSQKQVEIRRLLDLTQGLVQGAQIVDQLFAMQQRASPNVPPRVWEAIRQKFNVAELEPIVISIYERHFTEGEIRNLIAFYETPTGKKLIAKQPKIRQESMQAGQMWATKVLEQIKTELKEKGYSA